MSFFDTIAKIFQADDDENENIGTNTQPVTEEPEPTPEPEKPEEPATPEKPEMPTTPEEPATPEKPEKPEMPATPEKQEKPATPEEPEEPEKPATPKKPATEEKPAPEPQPAPEPKKPVFEFTGAIDAEDKFQKALLKALEPKVRGNKTVTRSTLTVLIEHDELAMAFGEIISDGSVAQALEEKFDVEWGVKFAAVKVTTQRKDDLTYIPAIDGAVYYNIKAPGVNIPGNSDNSDTTKPKKPAGPSLRATISVLEGSGNGSLAQDSYELDGNKILEMTNARMNIGAGTKHRLNGGRFRVNHIVISDDPASPEFNQNKYVSRAHAHISYDSKRGFLFYVDPNGTRVAGKRTWIFRDEHEIEVNNVEFPQILKDGDLIVLSKSVYLEFKIIK